MPDYEAIYYQELANPDWFLLTTEQPALPWLLDHAAVAIPRRAVYQSIAVTPETFVPPAANALAWIQDHAAVAMPRRPIYQDLWSDPSVWGMVRHAVIAVTPDATAVAVTAHVVPLFASSAWFAAAAHDTTLAALAAQAAGTLRGDESGAYAPIIAALFVDIGRLFSTGAIVDRPSAEWEIAEHGVGTILRDLNESDDTARLQNAHLVLRNEEQLAATFPLPLDNTVVHLLLGFTGLPFQDYLPLFWGSIDRHAIDYSITLALTDSSVKDNISLDIPISQYYPGAPSASRTKNLPIVLGILTDVPLIPVVQGAAGGTLAKAMTISDTTLALLEYGALFPDTGSVAVGLVAASATIGSGVNGTITVTARRAGSENNALTIQVFTTTAISAPLSVTQSGTAISVTLATNASGVPDNAQNTATLVAAALSALSSVQAVTSGTGATPLTTPAGPTVFAGGTDETMTYGTRTQTILNFQTVLVLGNLVRPNAAAHAQGSAVFRTNLAVTQHAIGLGTIVVNAVKYGGVPLPASQFTVIVDATHTFAVTLVQLPFVPDPAKALTADVNAPNIDTSDKIANGGFETGDGTGWTLAGATLVVGTTNPLPFAGTYRGALTGQLNIYGEMYQDITTLPGEPYEWSLAYQNARAPSLVIDGDFENGLVGWTTRGNVTAVLDTPTVLPVADGTHSARAQADLISIAVPVPNGNFESGTVDGWIFSGLGSLKGLEITTDAHSGTYAGLIRADRGEIGQGYEESIKTQAAQGSLPGVIGAQTTLSFWYKNTAGATLAFGGLQVLIMNAATGFHRDTLRIHLEVLAIQTAWTFVTMTFTNTVRDVRIVPWWTGPMDIYFFTNGLDHDTGGNPNLFHAFIDDVTLSYQAPAPTYSITLYQDIAVTSGQPYTFQFSYLTGRNIIQTPGPTTELSNIRYALGTPANEEAYLPASAVGQSHSFHEGIDDAGNPPGMVTTAPQTVTATDVTLRVRFELFGSVTPLDNGHVPHKDTGTFLPPFPARLDAVQLVLGTGVNESEASVRLGTPTNASAYLEQVLPQVYGWTKVVGQFQPLTDVSRITLRTRYTFSVLATFLDAISVHTVFSVSHRAGGKNPIDAIRYILATFVSQIRVEARSFAQARSRLSAWEFGGLLTAPGMSDTLLQRMAQQCKSVLVRDPLGRLTITVLDNSRTILATFDPTNMPITMPQGTGALLQESGPLDKIYSDFYVYFGTLTGGSTSVADFAGVVFATPTLTNLTGDAATDALQRCNNALTLGHGRTHRLDYFAEWIQDLQTAILFLQWLLQRHTSRDELLTFHTWLDALPLQLAQVVQVQHPLLPNQGAAVRAELMSHQFDASAMQVRLRARRLGPAPVPPPVARPIILTTLRDKTLTAAIADFATASTGAKLDLTTVDLNPNLPGQQSAFLVQGVGTFVVDGSGILTFTPVTHALGLAPTGYTVADTFGTSSNVAALQVTVLPEVPPAAQNVSLVTARNAPITISLVPSVTPAPGYTIVWSTLLVNGVPLPYTFPGLGTLTTDGLGNITFTPVTNALGVGITTYQVQDSSAVPSNSASLQVTIVAFLVPTVPSFTPYLAPVATSQATAVRQTPLDPTASSQATTVRQTPLDPTATRP